MDVKIVYILLFPNGKRYVGQTKRTLEERMRLHYSCAKKENVPLVDRAINKYGKESIKVEKVFILKCTQDYLGFIEDRAIRFYNTLIPSGYNIREGGARGHFCHSQEARVKISLARKGKPSWHKGRCRSEETKRNISSSLKGRCISSEHREKISIALSGRRHTEETKRKMSTSKKGAGNSQSKLTRQQIEEIRSLYIPHHKEYGVVPLAKKYGIDYTNMLRIVTYKSYND